LHTDKYFTNIIHTDKATQDKQECTVTQESYTRHFPKFLSAGWSEHNSVFLAMRWMTMNTCNVLTEINSQYKAFLVYFKYH